MIRANGLTRLLILFTLLLHAAALGRSCFVEEDLLLSESAAPQFSRVTKEDLVGIPCCKVCQDDPKCLYGLYNGVDCFTAPYIEPSYVKLQNNRMDQGNVTSFWMDDAVKRGNWCDKCDCLEESRTINCTGHELMIVPKTFSMTWSPRVVDLQGNPNLTVLGSGMFAEVGDSLQELRLPKSMKHISVQSLEELPILESVIFESGVDLYNTISSKSHDSYGDVCCSPGTALAFSNLELTMCDMNKYYPGVDSTYEPFIDYPDGNVLLVLFERSTFLSEAAESWEKCAEYCTFAAECNYFVFDARLPNSQHGCYLYKDNGSGPQTVCCEADHYADIGATIPGYVSGRPPKTRHLLDGARVTISPVANLIVSEQTGFETQYQLGLAATPLRGAVWVEPRLSTPSALQVEISPPRVVLYNANETVDILVRVRGVNRFPPDSTTLLVQNKITACDVAFMSTDEAHSTFVHIAVVAPEPTEEDANLKLAFGIPATVVVLLFPAVFWVLVHNRREKDSIWKIDKADIKFRDPPDTIGHGTFGPVLLGEYRGTQVAVKSILPSKEQGTTCASLTSEALFNHQFGSATKTCSPEVPLGQAEPLVENICQRIETSDSNYSQLTSATVRRGRASTTSQRATRRRMRNDFVEEMRLLSKLQHPCITTIMGAVIGLEPLLVTEYMDHGSLHDILQNDTIVLEGSILLPILNDISRGMRFLHLASPQIVHGDLKARNILVDNRLRAKISDFGLSQKKTCGISGSPFWMAPELLRGETAPTVASDVYSFGIVLCEVYNRKEPYEGEDPTLVLRDVADQKIRKRPVVSKHCPPRMRVLLTDCLVDEVENRPTSDELDIRLKRADTQDVESEALVSKKAVSLFDIFPRHVAEALQEGRTVESDHRDCVTIFFSDIVDFTRLFDDLSPSKVMNLLDRLHSKFDALSEAHGIFKVETIGDSYMAVTNLVSDQATDHVRRIAEFSMEAVALANSTPIDEDDNDKGYVQIRVGFHSGPVVADVVGTRNPRYCLFGDAVNIAARMESNSKENRIHCSDTSAQILSDQWPELPLRSRGFIPIKGKGEMHTFWVNEGERGKVLPVAGAEA